MAQHTPSLVALPKSFTTKTTFIALGIVAFFAIYLTIVALFLWLLSYVFEYSLMLLGSRIHFITILIFLGANGFLVMILIFLLKIFIPSGKDKEENQTEIEIKPHQHPELFKLIYEVADGVNTFRPRKVFLTPDVNASVFHERSLISLFIPSHQNLNIGLGLVNSLSVVELKAVLAHEFGHFSQNITRVSGSIYRINKLIVEMLYNNGGWENTVRNSGEIHGVIAIFASLALFTAAGIRLVFQKIYELVNLPYMSLSRDLEFHADAIAVTLTGREALVNALRKIDFTNVALNSTNNYLNEFFEKDKVKCANMYKVHQHLIVRMAQLNNVDVNNGLIHISPENLDKMIQSRVFYKDQWATHPSQKEREENIAKYGQAIDYAATSSWTLFTDENNVQETMTTKVYGNAAGIKTDESIQIENADSFNSRIDKDENDNSVDPAFNNFYYDRIVSADADEVLKEYNPNAAALLKFDKIYSVQTRNKHDRLQQNIYDKQVLEAIKAKTIKTSFFEFDNKRYKRKDAPTLIKQLTKEIEEQEKWLEDIDAQSFYYNLYHAEKAGETTKQEYLNTYKNYRQAAICAAYMLNFGNYLYQEIVSYANEVQNEDDLKPYLNRLHNNEKMFKTQLNLNGALNFTEGIPDADYKQQYVKYIETEGEYFIRLFSISNKEIDAFFDFLRKGQNYLDEQKRKQLHQLSNMQMRWAKQ